MVNKGRIICCAILVCVIVLALCGCGGEKQVNVPVADIAAEIGKAVSSGESMASMDALYIQGAMGIDVSDYAEYHVSINEMGTSIDEYGVFKAKDDAQADEIEKAVEAYIRLRKDSWIDGYNPEEKPKLEDAKVHRKGSYIMYCILGGEDVKAAEDAFGKKLS